MGGVVGEMVNKAISAFNSVKVEVKAELGKNKYKVLIDAYMQILKITETGRKSHLKYQKFQNP